MPLMRNPNAPVRPPGRPQVYPWAQWLDGRTHRLYSGLNFTVPIESFRRQAYTRAKRDGVAVTIKTLPNGIEIKAGGQPMRYDWDTLLDGEIHTLLIDRDLTAAPESFRQYARRQALARGMRLESRMMGNTLTFRAVRPASEAVREDNPAGRDELPFEVEG